VVINKADGDNVRKSELARRQYENALHIFPEQDSGWKPLVRTASAVENKGISEVWDQVLRYKQLVDDNGYFQKNRKEQQVRWMYDNIDEGLKRLFYRSPGIREQLRSLEEKITASEISPVEAAESILEAFRNSLRKM